MRTATERLEALGLQRKRFRAGEWWLLDGAGMLVGTYGGVPHARWATLADGTEVAGPTTASAAAVLGCLLSALETAAQSQEG